jgi:predicted nucleic acid-binding protein
MRTSTRIRRPVSSGRNRHGLIDTSVVIDLDVLTADQLPELASISAITFAELVIGPLAAADALEGARRQDRLQRAESAFDVLPFDHNVARAYGQIYAAVAEQGRKARGARALDLLIAATALSAGLPLYTRNPEDLRYLDRLIEIVPVTLQPRT